MSKRMLWLVQLAVLAAPVAAARLEVGEAAAAPGSSVIVPVMLRAEGASISGLQFDLSYDQERMQVAVVAGEAARRAVKALYRQDLGAQGVRVLVVGINAAPMEEGAVALLFIGLEARADEGDYPIAVRLATAVDGEGRAVTVDPAAGVVRVRRSLPLVRLLPEGVLNSASLQPGPIAPGELITLLGSGLSVAGTPAQVFVNGAPAPVLFEAPGQINTMAPYALAGESARIEVRGVGEVRVPVAAAAPGIFTQNAAGTGQGAIFHAADGTANGAMHPAAAGEEILIYMTGAGLLEPAVTGTAVVEGPAPAVRANVTARIGAREAQVVGATAIPGVIAGVIQVRVVIPEGAGSGPAVPVELRVDGRPSQPGVTVALR